MFTNANNISDQDIRSLIAENNFEAWELLYDKYAFAMRVIIRNLTDNKTIAEEIFKEAFLQLKEKQILSHFSYSLYSCLLRHTQLVTMQLLKERKLIRLNANRKLNSYLK